MSSQDETVLRSSQREGHNLPAAETVPFQNKFKLTLHAALHTVEASLWRSILRNSSGRSAGRPRLVQKAQERVTLSKTSLSFTCYNR